MYDAPLIELGGERTEPESHSPVDVARTWTIVTQSGSSYVLACDAVGMWWLATDNIPSARSCPLHDGVWPVQRPVPWPAVIGARLWIEALPLAPGDTRRVPGGGKDTSPVVRVTYDSE